MLFKNHPKEKKHFDDGAEIRQLLLSSINSSKSSIKVAVAWFTDEQLLDSLKAKATEGIQVSLVIADNEDNKKLPFESLQEAGGKVVRIKGKGFGTMHEKYAIFDEAYVIHGSYNWTNNAAKNNSESVIKSDDVEIVQSMLSSFQRLEDNQSSDQNNIDISPRDIDSAGGVFQVSDKTELDFLHTLDQITLGWTSEFEESKLKNRGREVASSCNGHADQVQNLLDGVLHEYRIQISQNDKGKARLLDNIDVVLAHHIDRLKEESLLSLDITKKEAEADKKLLMDSIDWLEKEENEQEVKLLTVREEVTFAEKEIEEHERNILDLEENIDTRKIKWYKFVPLLLLATAMLMYLFTFYSSAIYILINAQADAQEMVEAGLNPQVPEVYDAIAWRKASERDDTTLFFCFVAVLVPVGLSLLKLYTKNKTLAEIGSWLIAIIGVDLLVAYKVTDTINEVEYLIGQSDELHISIAEAFGNPDFWLVFVLGALPLLLFKYMAENLSGQISLSNVDDQKDINRARIKKTKKLVKKQSEKLGKNRGAASAIELSLEMIRKEIKTKSSMISETENSLEKDLNRTDERELRRITSAERIHKIYKSNITENHFRITGEMLRGRIAATMSGWKDFLFEYFSDQKAIEKWNLADQQKLQWWKQNLKASEDETLN